MTFKRICAFLLSAVLLCMALPAQANGLDWALSAYLDSHDDVSFHMTARLESLVPYGDDTIAMMNALLASTSVSAQLSQEQTEMSVCIAGESAATLAESESEDGLLLTTDLLPRRSLLSRASAMDRLSGFAQQESSFDLFAAVQETEGCYQALTDAILPYAEQKAANYNIKSIGSARWSRIARLTPEQGAELAPLIARVLGSGMNSAFRSQLEQMTYVNGFIVGLYQTAEGGDDLAVYIKGTVVFPDGAPRAISYQWAFAEDENGVRTDTYKFEMTKNQSPRDNREISASIRRKADEQSLLLSGQSKAAIREPETGVTVTTTLTYDLKGENGTLGGAYTQAVRTAKGETASTVTLTVSPDLTFVNAGGSAVLTGTAHVEQLQGKNVHLSLDLLFDEKAADELILAVNSGSLFMVADERLPLSSLNQNMDFETDEPENYLVGKPPVGYTAYEIPQNDVTVDLDASSPEEISALMDEMTQQLAGRLLKAAAKLPQEATALLRDAMSETDYAAFLELLEH